MINQLPAFFDARHMTKKAGRLFLTAEHTIKDYLVKLFCYNIFLYCILFIWEHFSKDKTDTWSAVEHLPEKCHRQVAAKGVRPCAEAGLLEQQGSDETHDRAHDADDHQGNRGGLLKYTA